MDNMGLNMLASWYANGDTILMEQMPIFGGYSGGVEETTICDIATTLASFALFNADLHLGGPIHIRWGVTTAAATLQISAHTAAAVGSCTDLLLGNQYYTLAGPCTEMCLLEAAAQAITDTGSGRALISGCASAKGVVMDKTTPMESRMMGEVATAVAGRDVEELNAILKTLIGSYEPSFSHAPSGKRFQDCYDLKTLTPTDEHIEVYDNAAIVLSEIGIDLQ